MKCRHRGCINTVINLFIVLFLPFISPTEIWETTTWPSWRRTHFLWCPVWRSCEYKSLIDVKM